MPNKHKLREFSNSFFLLYLTDVAGHILVFSSQMLYLLGARALASRLLLSGIRYSYNRKAIRILSKLLRENEFPTKQLLSKQAKKKDAESRALILSNPYYKNGELIKGVMILKFTHTFSYFPLTEEWDKLNRIFAFVLEPSWAGYADADIIYFAQQAEHCVIQATEILDRSLINSILPNVPCIDTGSSNWVDYTRFHPSLESTEKKYDAIYIANLNPIKRVYRAVDAMIEALSIDNQFKGLIVCAGWGSGKLVELETYALDRAPRDSITVMAGVPQPQLVDFLQQSKFSVLLSLKEGSNRVLFESMFVGLPVLCLAENIGVNKNYINSMTGILTYDSELPSALIYMMKNYEKHDSRGWARENISPEVTTRKLVDLLNIKYGEGINTQLEVKVNTPELNYFNRELEKESIMTNFFENLKILGEEDLLKSLESFQNQKY